jgi:aspartyl-tRNA(Asn)/glutamyl-tRNA(Gln) amidotransferase subunit A
VVPVHVPEAAERGEFFPVLLPADCIVSLGRERFLAERGRMDPVVAARAGVGLETRGIEVLQALRRHQELIRLTGERFAEIDVWAVPTTPIVARPVESFADVKTGLALTSLVTRNTQPGNMFGMCAASMPIHQFGSALPVGLQLLMPGGEDEALIALACAAETVLGRPKPADLTGFA